MMTFLLILVLCSIIVFIIRISCLQNDINELRSYNDTLFKVFSKAPEVPNYFYSNVRAKTLEDCINLQKPIFERLDLLADYLKVKFEVEPAKAESLRVIKK